jgi:hypothetical protein
LVGSLFSHGRVGSDGSRSGRQGQGSEIPAAPKVLKNIDLREKVVMGDALHTQRGISLRIVEASGDFIWLAKGNQPQMEEDIRLWFEPDPTPIPGMGHIPKDFEVAHTLNKGHTCTCGASAGVLVLNNELSPSAANSRTS